MPNALGGSPIRSFFAGMDDAAESQRQNALAKMRQTQFDQQNTQFQQGQQDRQQTKLREDGLQFWAGITQQETPEQRAQLYSQWRPSFVAQHPEAQQYLPEQYDDQAFGQLGFRLLPPEAATKIVAERYAPRQVTAEGQPFEAVQNGRPVFVQRYSDGSVKPIDGYSPPAPRQTAADSALVQVADDKSPTGFRWERRPNAAGLPAPAPRAQTNTKYSAKEMQAARDKVRVIGIAKQQLAKLKESRDKIKDTFASGPGFLPGAMSGDASNFDGDVDTMRDTITAITRTPGVGAMSDFETRLNQAKLPSRNEFESTRDRKIQALEDMLNQLEISYGELLSDPGPAAPAQDGDEQSVLDAADAILNGQ